MEAETAPNAHNAQSLLPLDEPRVIAIKDGKFTYTFHFGQITQADWDGYFDGIKYSSRNEGKQQVTTLELDMPGIELFENKLVKAEGYRGDFMMRPGWQAKIPPRHSYQVAWLLRLVSPSTEQNEESFDPESIEVRLDALWSQTRPGADTTLYKGLVHRFAPPTVQHKRRFYNAASQSIIVGGSRNGTTIYAKRHKVLLDLYDKLVLGVEGYSWDGSPLGGDLEAIRLRMDAYHKFTSVQQIFSSVNPADESTAIEAAA